MEIPQSVTEKFGTNGVSVYKLGHKDGKLEGSKTSKEKFAIEVNNMANQTLKGKEKEGYKAPSVVDCAKKSQSVFAIGKDTNRNDIKGLIAVLLKTLESMQLPVKTTTPKPKPS